MNEEGYIGAICSSPNGSTLTYEYDENGHLITYTDAAGVPTRYEYDIWQGLSDSIGTMAMAPKRLWRMSMMTRAE